jgi:DNA-binding transcriptional LysR family regulator
VADQLVWRRRHCTASGARAGVRFAALDGRSGDAGRGYRACASVDVRSRDQHGRLVRPFDVEVHAGSYWLTCLKGKPMTPAMLLFSQWIIDEAARHATN